MKRILKLLLIGVMVIFPNVVHAETLDVNSKEVKNLAEKYKIVNTDIYLFDVYYKITTVGTPGTPKINIKEMPNGYFASMITYLNKIKYREETRPMPNGASGEALYHIATKDDYNVAFKNTFGPDIEVKNIESLEDGTAYCGTFVYNKANDNYEAYQACGGTGRNEGMYLKKASKSNDTIIINTKLYSTKEINNKKYIAAYTPFFEFDEESKISVDSFTDTKTIDSKYGEYLNTYKFTFKKASDGEYYFYSVESLNDAKVYQQPNTKGNITVSNPKTADQNIIIISVVGIICLGILFACSKKIVKH